MIIQVKAKPNSKEEKIEKISEKEYNISIKEPAKDNKANIRLIKIFAKKFNVNAKNVIIKNPNSMKKFIEIKI